MKQNKVRNNTVSAATVSADTALGGGVVGPFHQYHHMPYACVFFQTLMDEVHRHRQESQGGHRSNRARVLGFVPRIGGVAGC